MFVNQVGTAPLSLPLPHFPQPTSFFFPPTLSLFFLKVLSLSSSTALLHISLPTTTAILLFHPQHYHGVTFFVAITRLPFCPTFVQSLNMIYRLGLILGPVLVRDGADKRQKGSCKKILSKLHVGVKEGKIIFFRA